MTFTDLNLNSDIIKTIEAQDYQKPTLIQEKAIPELLNGKDLLGCAKTGTGKTAAFTIPIVQRLLENQGEGVGGRPVRALILAPTRELAIQIGEYIEVYTCHTTLQVGVIFGGITPKRHIKVMKREPDIIVATPGRLLDFVEQGHINLEAVEIVVLDEADQMLDEAMLQTVKKIKMKLPKERQTVLFSATMPKEVMKLANSFLKNPIKIGAEVTATDKVDINQLVYYVEEPDKANLLLQWLKEQSYESVLVFVRTKKKADQISKRINVANIRNKAIHGDKSQSERQKALALFKNKEIKVLIATDVAARGIDIDKLSHVVNMDIPSVPETYIHRIGRTGRAQMHGTSLAFCSQEELPYLKAIEELQGKSLKEITL